MKKVFSLIFLIFLVAGCATQPPASIRHIPTTKVSVAQVRADFERFKGAEVRWGGEIVYVENRANDTWIEVVSRTLGNSGRPNEGGYSDGRFIASFKGFADPVVYQTGQQLTVLGEVQGLSRRTIGEYEYAYPVVSVTGSYLWQPEPEVRYEPVPWWYYDPWPFYPPWPYYPPYYW